ncbi:hypothetical protein D6810_01525 [Candidatus Dojkabacteria bacterium]|uniref:Uncharacterized protein n=1 Tax=Candidatus Dojkabacteria bacterium TaxID=2099670 RepID=A0A3M0YYJ8_9BACT|nr:MAG: hypothetical protein D6810_01525 [Candidatus Dojkabacteria bacterium]
MQKIFLPTQAKRRFFSEFLVISCFIVSIISLQTNQLRVLAQGFSGNNPSSYQCFDEKGNLLSLTPEPGTGKYEGSFVCVDGNKVYPAYLKPPSLQQIEVWFVRIVYTIWALVATFSFVLLLGVAYQYMISRDAGGALAKARDRIAKYFLGFALVFLAVPILSTTFRLLGVNDSVKCYSTLTGGGENNIGIGFQFFFSDLCTDPRGRFADPQVILDMILEVLRSSDNIIEKIERVYELIAEINGTACDNRIYPDPMSRNILNGFGCLTNVCSSDGTWDVRFTLGSCPQ